MTVKKTKTLSLILAFIFIGVFCLAQTTQAFWDKLIGAVTFGPMVMIGVILYAIGVISHWLTIFAGSLIDYVLSPSFISWSYTNPDSNEIIKLGLNITRDFTNAILVLVLVYTALATILRLAGYETKKMLATFVLVALLVNFSHVICGLIVDASNIGMNFFIKGTVGGDTLISAAGSTWNTVESHIQGTWDTFNISTQSAIAVDLIFEIIVQFNIFLIYTLFAGVFIIRYIAIWKLVIMSPIAFACYILPSTRRYWQLWWHQFIRWSFIGITMSFWLYLADKFSEFNPVKPISGVGGVFLPQIFAIAFLWLAFANGFSTGAAGSNMITGWTRRINRWILVDKGWRRGMKPFIEDIHTKEGKGVKDLVGALTKKWETVPVARALLPDSWRKYAEYQPSIEEERKRIAPYSSPEIGHRIATGADYGVAAVSGMVELIERADFQDFINPFKKKYKVDTEAELFSNEDFKKKTSRLLGLSFRGGYHNTLLRGDPRLARMAAGSLPGYDTLNEDQAVAKATSEARSQHIKNWEKDVLDDEKIIGYGMERGRDFWQAVQSNVKKGHETALETVAKLFNNFLGSPEGQTFKGKDFTDTKVVSSAWEAFRKDFMKKHDNKEGFFQYMGEPYKAKEKAKEQGWTAERVVYLATKKESGTPPSGGPTTPGEAMGLGKVIDVGAARAKKRKKPDVGEP